MTKMSTGWMWLDASGKTLKEKVLKAVKKYQERHEGYSPDTCYVHPTAVESEQQIGLVRVIPVRRIPLHHFWLGQEEQDG